MIVDEKEFFPNKLPSILQGTTNPFVLIASPRLADMFQEGELQISLSHVRIGILHSTESGSHIARSALGHHGERIYAVYAARNEYHRVVRVAEQLRSHDPGGTIIIASCDCDHVNKRRAFAEPVRMKAIDYAVLTADCGGVQFMGELIIALKKYTTPIAADQATSLS